jgi:hypothetical protein
MVTLLSCRRRDHHLGCLPLPAHCSALPASRWQHPSCSNACDSAHAFTPRPSPNDKLSPPVNAVGTLWVPAPASHRTCPCAPGGRLCIPVHYTLRISAIVASGVVLPLPFLCWRYTSLFRILPSAGAAFHTHLAAPRLLRAPRTVAAASLSATPRASPPSC